MFGPALLDRTAALLTARNRIEAELARTVREADVMQASEHDGLKTMASWLRGRGRLAAGQERAGANGTTRHAITASGSNEIRRADGTPTGPTAPRS